MFVHFFAVYLEKIHATKQAKQTQGFYSDTDKNPVVLTPDGVDACKSAWKLCYDSNENTQTIIKPMHRDINNVKEETRF